MFSSAELGHTLAPDDYDEQLPQLRVDLINAQYDHRERDFPVVVLVTGDDQLAARRLLRGMHEWLDARYLDFRIHTDPPPRALPPFRRYWTGLPSRGRIGVFLNAWAADPIRLALVDGGAERAVPEFIRHTRAFEQMLVDDGALVIKLWLHLPKANIPLRLQELADEHQEWRLDELDRALMNRHDEIMPFAEQLVQETSTAAAPWQIVESTDRFYANLTSARIMLNALQRRLANPPPPPPPPTVVSIPDGQTVLDAVDLTQKLDKGAYRERLLEAQAALRDVAHQAARRNIASVLVFEGWDAAGKGGAIRRLTSALDIRDFRIVPIGAPTPHELAHHYLWRFWTRIPAAGKTVIFDRSWYGRVLVERVEGYAREDEWRRAYTEIRDFEEQLTGAGVLVIKFWLHIDPEEQLARFKAREKTAFKKYKLTEDDHRNRAKWGAYAEAVDEMVARTDTPAAPWRIIPANDKKYARVAVIETYLDALRARLA